MKKLKSTQEASMYSQHHYFFLPGLKVAWNGTIITVFQYKNLLVLG